MVRENFGEKGNKDQHIEKIRYLLGGEYIFSVTEDEEESHFSSKEREELEWYRKNHPDWVERALLLEKIEDYADGVSMSDVEKMQFENEFRGNEEIEALVKDAIEGFEKAELDILLGRRDRLTSEKDFERIDTLLEKYPEVAGEVGDQEKIAKEKQQEILDSSGEKKFLETISRHLKGYFASGSHHESILIFPARDFVYGFMRKINNHPQKTALAVQAIKETLGEELVPSEAIIFDFLKTKYKEIYGRNFYDEGSEEYNDE